MLFNSWSFIALVAITFALYYARPLERWQVLVLILASFAFYAANDAWLLLLLIGSIAINITTSHLVMHGRPNRRLLHAAAGVTLNLAILALFKYGPLIGHSFLPETSSIGQFLVSLPLPIGISFFTFQGITLLVDCLRERRHGADFRIADRPLRERILQTTLYIAFFPQLVAGPIVKAHDFLPQIGRKRLDGIDWSTVYHSLVIGYFLKIVVADNLKDQTFWLAWPHFERFSTHDLLAMLFAYSMQIFADFAGYSLIAIGIAALFGYRLPQNFNFPYLSRSIAEFWRRWHISLSSFLKEYLYFPLGGNRKGRLRTYVNLMTVMLLGGLWHGAAWSYMVWGGCHGLALVGERILRPHIRPPRHGLVEAVRMLLVLGFVTFSWLLFKLPEFGQVLAFLRCLVDNTRLPDQSGLALTALLYSLPVVVYHVCHLLGRQRQRSPLPVPALSYPLAYATMLFLIVSNPGQPGAFVYFQF